MSEIRKAVSEEQTRQMIHELNDLKSKVYKRVKCKFSKNTDLFYFLSFLMLI